MRGLTWQTLRLSLAGSLETSDDVRASDPRTMAIAKDVQFEETGGAQTRHPFDSTMTNVFGGGTLSNCRRIYPINDELVAFTDAGVYSWDSELSKWVSRGAHLGVAVGHQTRFATAGDQWICDIAELNGTVVMSWADGASMFVAAFSKATGAVLMAPASPSGAQRGRLLTLATRVLLFTEESGNKLTVRALDPADPATGVASASTTVVTSFTTSFDVVRVLGSDQAAGASMQTTTTNYLAFTVTAGLAVATSLKARTCDSRIAVASRPPSGAQFHVFRGVSATTAVVGDVLTTSTLADVTTGQAIGTYTSTPSATAMNFITACYRSVQTTGHYVCVVFWNAQVSTGPFANFPFDCKTNTVDDAGTIGTQATFVTGVFLASRAFDYAGSVYVNMQFDQLNFAAPAGAGSTLNTQYLLYREDRTLHAKMVSPTAGELGLVFPGWLPNASSVDGLTFSWAGTLKRIASVPTDPSDGTIIGGAAAFGARSPVAITIAFDSNDARRLAQIGRTAYISGGEILQYDGVRLVECGFNVFQYDCYLVDGGPATGLMAAGTYGYKSTFWAINSQGETERSTTGAIASVVIGAANSSATTVGGSLGPLFTSRRTAVLPSVEVWRTTVNTGAPYYLVTSLDPTVTSNPNRYLQNSTSGIAAFVDALADSTASTHAANPENGGVLESLAPPPATIIFATDDRVFLLGVAGDPDRGWYSRLRADGEVASFHDGLTFDVPRKGGTITAGWFQDEVLYVGRGTAIYALPGVGLDNLGQGQNFGPAREVSLDVGPVSQESVAKTPLGTVFKSRKGWYLLERGGGVRLIGSAVARYDSETVNSATVVESLHHVRILTSARMLVWDYRALVDPTDRDGVGKWMEWSIADGVHACMWNGRYVYLTATGPRIEATDFTGTTHGLDLETKWLPLTELQAAAKVRAAGVLGEYRSAHLVRIRAARDWQYDGAGNVVYFDDHAWSPSPTTVGSALQVMTGLTQDSMQALKLRITAVTDAARATLVTTTLSPLVDTDSSAWNATWRAAKVASDLTAYGEMGNRITMSIAYTTFTPTTLDEFPFEFSFEFIAENGAVIVNDHFTWNVATGKWEEDLNNIGVLVAGSLTVAELESAIAEGTVLATLQTADALPTKVVDVAGMLAAGDLCAAGFSGGAYGTPTGEALKLTNLALEVGLRPGLTKRLPAEQRT